MSSPAAPAGPVTATGTTPRNVHGQAIAATVFSTVRRRGRLFLPLLFLYATLVPRSRATLGKLSFIHFARWSLVRRIPFNGPPQRRERLRYAHLYFESNFNGGWEEYIDAFSHVLTRGMQRFWGSSYGFPQPLPTGRFKDYIRRNAIETSHYYSAYPEATTTMVLAALELDRRLAEFGERARDLEPEAFAAAWRDLLTDVQRCL